MEEQQEQEQEQEQEWVTVPVRTLVNYLSDSGVSYEKIAKLWGVSKLQVFYYSNGKTKRPSVKVAMAVFTTTMFEGKKAILEHFHSEEHLKTSFEMYKKGL